MSFDSFPDLNADCKLEVIKHWMLEHDAKIYKVVKRPDGSLHLSSTRPKSENALTLVSHEMHELYEGLLDSYAVYVLEVNGFDAERELAKYAGAVPFDKVRYMRLGADFLRCDQHVRGLYKKAIENGLSQLTQVLMSTVPNLVDLELSVVVDGNKLPLNIGDSLKLQQDLGPSRALRDHIVYKFADGIKGMKKLATVHVRYVLINYMRQVSSMAKGTKHKTPRGWRQVPKQLEVNCANNDGQIAAEAKKIGLEIDPKHDYEGRAQRRASNLSGLQESSLMYDD